MPTLFEHNKETELLFGPVIEAGIEALNLSKHTGKIFMFHSNLPNAHAPGQLKNRDDKKVLGTDKEKQVLQASSQWKTQSCRV